MEADNFVHEAEGIDDAENDEDMEIADNSIGVPILNVSLNHSGLIFYH